MQTPEVSDDDFSNLVFYGTSEDLQAMREAETPHTQTRIIHRPNGTGELGESGYSITTKHGPRKQLVCHIHERKAVEQLIKTGNQYYIYSYKREEKTTVAYRVQTMQLMIKNTNPHFTCADVDNNNFDHNNNQNKLYQCEDCEKYFSRISEYKTHLVEVVAKICNSCGKRFQDHQKYLFHCLGHGDPDRECSVCRKVLVNKYSLKKHRSICKKKVTTKWRKSRKPPKTASN